MRDGIRFCGSKKISWRNASQVRLQILYIDSFGEEDSEQRLGSIFFQAVAFWFSGWEADGLRELCCKRILKRQFCIKMLFEKRHSALIK